MSIREFLDKVEEIVLKTKVKAVDINHKNN